MGKGEKVHSKKGDGADKTDKTDGDAEKGGKVEKKNSQKPKSKSSKSGKDEPSKHHKDEESEESSSSSSDLIEGSSASSSSASSSSSSELRGKLTKKTSKRKSVEEFGKLYEQELTNMSKTPKQLRKQSPSGFGMRAAVSKKKRRYREGKYDLDLACMLRLFLVIYFFSSFS
jgi:hypothetical protein